jgi:hypothetical protein
VISKYIQLGGLLTLFILSLVVPGTLVLTALQLSLMAGCVLVTYQNFGDQLIKFYQSLKGGNDGSSQTEPSREGNQERTQDSAAGTSASPETQG